MYIYAIFSHNKIISDKVSDKKKELTTTFNRTDNFINLALFGAQKCVGDLVLPSQSVVYLASRNGNLNTTWKVLNAIFREKKLPMPFHFLNSVNAAKLFYIAKSFCIEGKTLYVDRFESAVPQAYVDVKNNKTVLLGVVSEVFEDLKVHHEIFGDVAIEEESRWILLANEFEGAEPLAKISEIKFDTKGTKDAIANLFEFLSSVEDETNFHFRGDNLSFKVERLKSK